MSIRNIKSSVLLLLLGVFLSGCTKEMDTTFQQTRPDPEVRLLQVFDETPAIKSMFSNIDEAEFNRRANDMLNANPELSAQIYFNLAGSFYGPDAVLPQTVRAMADGLKSFHAVYSDDPGSLDATFDVVDDVLSIDSAVMMDGVESITDVLEKMRNWDDANSNGRLDPGERQFYDANESGVFDAGDSYFYWDLFGPYQELSDIGYDGINLLIENFNFVHSLYDGAENMDDPKVLMQNFMQTIVDTNKDVEKSIADVIDYLENPKPGESVQDIEEEVADWMIADPVKVEITTYLISTLYPMIKEPVLEDVELPEDFETLELPECLKENDVNSEDHYKNFVRRGRWLLDEQMKILAATPKGLSLSANIASVDETPLTQWLVDTFYKDVKLWDDLESVPIFDFDNNELLRWLGKSGTYTEGGITKYSVGDQLKKALSLSGDPGITRQVLQDLLWNGISYTSTNGVTTKFKGLMYTHIPGNPDYTTDDGYLIRMAKFKSGDNTEKPFRIQAKDRLNGKDINLSYDGESQLETILTNLQLHILQDYYSTKDNIYKWSLTPEDGKAFFGDPDRNIQTLLGGITQSLRNTMILDRDGTKSGDLSALSELLYVMAASYGVVDPVGAPGELSVQNCMKSLGSPLGNQTYIESDAGLFTIKIEVMGRNDIYRQSSLLNPVSHSSGSWVKYATQHGMPANELLQPGTFRRREGLSGVYEWYGKFSGHQGDVIGITDANGKIITTNWNMAEIAQACWEGYGPYTYRGLSPNGSSRKYENSFYTDWYYIDQNYFSSPKTRNGPKGPGLGEFNREKGRYHFYESVYVPGENDDGFVDSGFIDRQGKKIARYGYIRKKTSGTDVTRYHFSGGNYTDPVTHFPAVKPEDDPGNVHDFLNGGNRVTLDCSSREEAVRKNLHWALNQKKYVYVIPIHAATRFGWWIFSADIEIFAYNVIVANGVAGITNAKRYGNQMSHNAVWGSGLSTNYHIDYQSADNYFLNLVNEGSDTSRFDGVSFLDMDYCVLLDYRYYVSGLFGGLAKALVDMTVEIWNSLGDGNVLPQVVGQNMKVMLTMANKTYETDDIVDSGYNKNASQSMDQFEPYFTEYYPELDLAAITRDDQYPPVPRVNGIKYPTGFDSDGIANEWTEHKGTNKGMFDDFLVVLGLIVGTIHEDGTVCANWSKPCNSPATADQIDKGQFTYFAREGFRGQLDNFILTTVALNQTRYNSSDGKSPVYNTEAITNILVDHDPVSNTTSAGSRKGVLPSLLNSKYANINYLDPIKTSIEKAVRNVVRSYLNYYTMSKGPDPLVNNGDLVPYMVEGERNPDINWDVPLYRLMYFVDNISLDQMKRSLDMVRDLSQDTRFVEFFKESIPAVNSYLYVKWLEENWDGTGVRPEYDEAVDQGLFTLSISDEDIDKVVDFLNDFRYDDFIKFIQDTRINDFEGLYNFSFDNWGKELTPGVLHKELGNLNTNLVKYFGVNLLEGAVLGIYEIKETVMLSHIKSGVSPEDDYAVFNPGDMLYGHGKYVEFDEAVDGNGDEILELTHEVIDSDGNGIVDGGADWDGVTSVVFSSDRYYKYIDLFTWLEDNSDDESKCKILFKGLKTYIDFRIGTNDEFQEYGLSYRTIWYKAGAEHTPNVFNLHNYDVRMDWLMSEYNKNLINYESDDFQFGKALEAYEDPIGKNNTIVYRPATIIDWLFGWNGSSNQGMSIPGELNFAKNVAIDQLFDGNEFTVPDPADNFKEDYIATPRQIVQDYRDYLFENILEYEYAPGKTETYHTVSSGKDLDDGHRHAVNNITEIIAELLSPVRREDPEKDNPNYVIGALFESWERFVDAADIDPDNLKMVQKAVGNLLWDPAGIQDMEKDDRDLSHLERTYDPELDTDVGYYTHVFSNMTEHAPDILKRFQGMYADLTQLGLLTFSDDGIGTYLMDVMQPAERYDSWDMVEEFNYLINTPIFQDHSDRDTFWWQAGNLIEDMAIVLLRREERNESPASMDYFGAISGMFR